MRKLHSYRCRWIEVRRWALERSVDIVKRQVHKQRHSWIVCIDVLNDLRAVELA